MEDISKFYNRFFGTGYWEKQYKPHIVAFAEHCVKAVLENKEVLKTSPSIKSCATCEHEGHSCSYCISCSEYHTSKWEPRKTSCVG